MLLFSGSANRTLAQTLATQLSIPLSSATIDRFPDGELKIKLQTKVRGADVCIVQATSPPVNDNLLELCLMVNALRRNGAKRIFAIVPYMGYMRQDFAASTSGTPLSAQVVANIINSLALDRLITLDLHSAKLQEFFTCPVDNLSSLDIFLPALKQKKFINPIIVSPDIGGVARANKFAESLNFAMAVIHKREPCGTNSTIIGDVNDRDCIIVDDIIATGNTLCNAAAVLRAQGARDIYAYCTHNVCSIDATARIKAENFKVVVTTTSIELQNSNMFNNILKQYSIAPLLAESLSKHFILSGLIT